MSTQKTVLVILGLGFLASMAMAPIRAKGTDTGALNPQGKKQAYLTVTLPANDSGPLIPTTVTNPRADEGEVFYITDVLTEYDVSLKFPIEFAGSPTKGFLYLNDRALTYSFITPLPLSTSIVMKSSAPFDFMVVLAGYYSRAAPEIEVMGIE